MGIAPIAAISVKHRSPDMVFKQGSLKSIKNKLPLAVIEPMRLIVPFVLALVAFTGCDSPFASHAAALKPIASPSGDMTLTPSVNQSNADPTKYLCVAFYIHDKSGVLLHSIQSSASDTSKWAIGWFDDDTIVLYSSDIGTYAWQLSDDGTISQLDHPLPGQLKEHGDRIKASKYAP